MPARGRMVPAWAGIRSHLTLRVDQLRVITPGQVCGVVTDSLARDTQPVQTYQQPDAVQEEAWNLVVYNGGEVTGAVMPVGRAAISDWLFAVQEEQHEAEW